MTRREKEKKVLDELLSENARLRGENLVTGIILTQLLQSLVKAQLNPHVFAERIVRQAQNAVAEFQFDNATDQSQECRVRSAAMEAVRYYDTQIRLALPI